MVPAQIFCRVVVLLAGVFFTACSSYRVFPVDTLKPAPIPVVTEGKIGILERNISYQNTPVKFREEERARLELLKQFAIGVKTLFEEVDNRDSLLFMSDARQHSLHRPHLPEAYPADTVRSFCRQFGLDYLISLEVTFFEIQESNLSYNWFVRLYSPHTFAPLDSVLLMYEIGNIHDFEYYDDLYELLKIVARDKGAEYARRIVPYWETTERRIYNKGKILRLGDAYFREGQEEKAVKVWEGATRLGLRTAVKAVINIAWMYENRGEFDRAYSILMQMLKTVKEKKYQGKDAEYLKTYSVLLSERIEEEMLLEQQMLPVSK